MGQAGVNMVVAGDRVHLGLAPETAKRTGKDDAVMVFVKGTAPQFLGAVKGFAQSFAGKQGLPIQGVHSVC